MGTQAYSRVEIADIALELFAQHGYEAVNATDIAQAAGVSRSTFFRQFGSKDDVIFADHDESLARVADFFADRAGDSGESVDAWGDVVHAAELVFEMFQARLQSIRKRDVIVRATDKLRDREIVTVTKYEKAFAGYLRDQVPGVRSIEAIQFAGMVAATHNAVLRKLIRGDDSVSLNDLRIELERVMKLFRGGRGFDDLIQPPSAEGVALLSVDTSNSENSEDAVVAVFKSRAPFSVITQKIRTALEER